MTPKQEAYKIQAHTIIQNLNKRNMFGYYCETAADARSYIAGLTAAGNTVSFGGSMTLFESGIMDDLKAREDITLLDRNACERAEDIQTVYHAAFDCDTYFMSTNAITLDGQLVNTDGTGNRVAALIYGPKEVIVIAGMNKVTSNIETAQARVKDIASPPNCVRLNRNTPCAVTGKCQDCLTDDCICSQTVITRRSAIKDRIKVILIGEELGY